MSEVLEAETGLGMFLAVFIGFFFVFVVIGIVLYIVQAIGLYKIAKTQKVEYEWLAWIPIANMFLMAMLVERDVNESLRGKYTMTYGIVYVVGLIGGMVFAPLAILPTIMTYYTFYHLARKYSANSVAHIIIAIVTLGFAMPFQIFRFRNREPVVEVVGGVDWRE